MTANLEKRLEALESTIKSAADSPIWVDGEENVIRVDVAGRRGKTIEFPDVCEARIWLEQMINTHPAGGVMNYHVANICDLHEHAPLLKDVIRDILPGEVVIPDLRFTLKNNVLVLVEKTGVENHPITLTVDYLPGTLGMCGIRPGTLADIRTWALASLIATAFDNAGFRRRWPNMVDNSDQVIMTVCLAIFAWKNMDKVEKIHHDFARLFFQVVDHLGGP